MRLRTRVARTLGWLGWGAVLAVVIAPPLYYLLPWRFWDTFVATAIGWTVAATLMEDE